MQVLVIPDIHGLSTWRQVLKAHPKVDQIVFLGDYFDSFDSFDIAHTEQLANFQQILAAKLAEPLRITLLVGNHDYQYFDFVHEHYSGYNYALQRALVRKLDPLLTEGTLQAAIAFDSQLYSHAGVSKTWAADWGLAELYGSGKPSTHAIAEALNTLLVHRPSAFAFQRDPQHYTDPTGDNPWQGPLWIRPPAFLGDALCPGQIVGHTVLPKGLAIVPHPIAFSTDALWDGQYLLVEDGQPQAMRLKTRRR